jgi:hypothetical protein
VAIDPSFRLRRWKTAVLSLIALALVGCASRPAVLNGVAPRRNVISFNLCHGSKWLDEDPAIPSGSIRVTGNMLTGDPDFVDAAHGDFRLRPDSPALAAGFPQVRLQEMGLPHGPW